MEPRPTREQILSELRALMSEMFDLDGEKIVPSAHLVDELGLDSIDAIDMAARLEEMTGCRVPEDALRKIRTVDDVVTAVERELAGR